MDQPHLPRGRPCPGPFPHGTPERHRLGTQPLQDVRRSDVGRRRGPRAARGLGGGSVASGGGWGGGGGEGVAARTHCSRGSEVFPSIQTRSFFHTNLSIGVSSPVRKTQVAIVAGTEGNVHPRPWTPGLPAPLRWPPRAEPTSCFGHPECHCRRKLSFNCRPRSRSLWPFHGVLISRLCSPAVRGAFQGEGQWPWRGWRACAPPLGFVLGPWCPPGWHLWTVPAASTAGLPRGR